MNLVFRFLSLIIQPKGEVPPFKKVEPLLVSKPLLLVFVSLLLVVGCARPGDDSGQITITGNDTIADFRLDKTEVTATQFAEFLNSEGNQTEGGSTWFSLADGEAWLTETGGVFAPKEGFEAHPIGFVSWYGAQAYCAWAGGRLPTSAEWAYAAVNPAGGEYPWGDETDGSQMNFCDANCPMPANRDKSVDDGFVRTAPVGSFPAGASWVGALDMAGNVWEWVDGEENGQKVVRGGSWASSFVDTVVLERDTADADSHFSFVGFRCAYSPVE